MRRPIQSGCTSNVEKSLLNLIRFAILDSISSVTALPVLTCVQYSMYQFYLLLSFSFLYNLIYSTRPFCSILAWAFRTSMNLAKSQPLFVPDITKLRPDREAAAKIEYRIACPQIFPRAEFLFFGGCQIVRRSCCILDYF
jgi:hypothetical protein